MIQQDFRIKTITNDKLKYIKNHPELFTNLLESNKGFVDGICRAFSSKNPLYDFDELYQEATIALWKSIEKYNPDREDKSTFSTFAHKVIFNDILQVIKKQNKVIKNENYIEDYRNGSSQWEDNNTHKAADYKEEFFIPITSKNTTVEEQVIDSIMRKTQDVVLSKNEREIYHMKFDLKMKLRDIAKKLKINFHTFKVIYYGSFIPKLNKINKIQTTGERNETPSRVQKKIKAIRRKQKNKKRISRV